jgi:CRISPR type I-E-associated protein CasA/Cse1
MPEPRPSRGECATAAVSTRLNLATDPWIEVTDRDGNDLLLSLSDALTRAGQIAALGGMPPVGASVTRLLVAVLRDALGTAAVPEGDWRAWWDAAELPTDRITEYLERHHDRFYLHGDRPFMQDPALAAGDRTGGSWKSPAELRPDIPSGNNPLLYEQYTDLGGTRPYTMTPAEAANWLVSTQSFIRPGIFPGTDTPRVSGRGGVLLSRLVVVPAGPTLAHTLLLSLPTGPRDLRDRPVWRRDDAPVIAPPVLGPVSYLTWQCRHILLDDAQDGLIQRVKIAAANSPDPLVPRDQQAALDPHLVFEENAKSPDGWTILPYLPDRAVWRNAPTLAAYNGQASALKRARIMIGADPSTPIRVDAFGVAVESTAKYVDWNRTSVRLPRDPTTLEYARQTAEITEKVYGGLRRAAMTFLMRTGQVSATASPQAKASAAAGPGRYFWGELNQPGFDLPALLDEAKSDEARASLVNGWGERCLEAAIRTLTHMRAGYGVTGTAATSYASALNVLRNALKPEETTDGEDEQDTPGDADTGAPPATPAGPDTTPLTLF